MSPEGDAFMGSIKFHEIWIEQCKAAIGIKLRFGLTEAFDYIVMEKLVEYMNAAVDHPEFARELPRFISTVRQMFTFEEIGTQISRVELEHQAAVDLIEDVSREADEDDDLFLESPAAVAERARRFDMIKELLTAPELGTA
jgi:hypothetical protein